MKQRQIKRNEKHKDVPKELEVKGQKDGNEEVRSGSHYKFCFTKTYEAQTYFLQFSSCI